MPSKQAGRNLRMYDNLIFLRFRVLEIESEPRNRGHSAPRDPTTTSSRCLFSKTLHAPSSGARAAVVNFRWGGGAAVPVGPYKEHFSFVFLFFRSDRTLQYVHFSVSHLQILANCCRSLGCENLSPTESVPLAADGAETVLPTRPIGALN